MKAKLFLTAATVTILGCTSVRPNIQAGNPNVTGIPIVRQVPCTSGGFGTVVREEGDSYFPGNATQGEIGGIAAILLSSLVTRGVDYVGERLKAGGEERTRTLEGRFNFFTDDPRVGCFDFQRGGIQFRFAMVPINGQVAGRAQPKSHVYFIVTGLRYLETVNLDRESVRGLSLTFEVTRPGVEDVVSQTISLGNVEVGSEIASIPVDQNPLVSGFITNPFISTVVEENTAPLIRRNLPFTLRVRLTEIRNANELSRFASGVVEDANDDLTAALIRALGVDDDDDNGDGDSGGGAGNATAPEEDQPPGEGQGANQHDG